MTNPSIEGYDSAAPGDYNTPQPDAGTTQAPGTPTPAPADNTPEQKQEGYSFLIGGNSAGLGTITVDNEQYSADIDGAYQGPLSATSDWTQMFFDVFEVGEKFIWFKTDNGGDVHAPKCFVTEGETDATPVWVENVLTWPENVVWNGDTLSPSNPDDAT